jgi:hypothetical protein
MSIGRMYRLGHLPTAAPYRITETNQVVIQDMRNWNFDLWRHFDVVSLKGISTDLLVLRDWIQSWVTRAYRSSHEFTEMSWPMRLAGYVDRMVTVLAPLRRNVPKCSRCVPRYDWIISALVLRPSCLPEKVTINKKRRVSKMIFPPETRDYRNRTQPARRNERAEIKKWCEFTRNVKAERRQTGGRKIRTASTRSWKYC